MKIEELVRTIRGNPIFATLSKQEAEDLSGHCEVLILPTKCRLFFQGDPANDMYVLFKGTLQIRVQDAVGNEMEVGRLSSGEVFGEMGVLENEPRSASLYAVEESIVLKIPGDGFFSMIDEGLPAIHLLLNHTLTKACSRLRGLDTRLDELFIHDMM